MRVLKTLFDKFGSPLHFTSAELSELAGTTPESTLRVMADLREMGVISTSRGKVWIADVELMRKLDDKNIRV
jgi:CRP/FNR family transcriptional regulator, nitrogen oxide reductase regulator